MRQWWPCLGAQAVERMGIGSAGVSCGRSEAFVLSVSQLVDGTGAKGFGGAVICEIHASFSCLGAVVSIVLCVIISLGGVFAVSVSCLVCAGWTKIATCMQRCGSIGAGIRILCTDVVGGAGLDPCFGMESCGDLSESGDAEGTTTTHNYYNMAKTDEDKYIR